MNACDGPTPERASRRSLHDQHGRIHLYCVASTVELAAVLDSPELMAAVVQDACLSFAVQDWFGRLPSHWHHRARVRWNAEGAFLDREKQRLAQVMEQALTATPMARPEDC